FTFQRDKPNTLDDWSLWTADQMSTPPDVNPPVNVVWNQPTALPKWHTNLQRVLSQQRVESFSIVEHLPTMDYITLGQIFSGIPCYSNCGGSGWGCFAFNSDLLLSNGSRALLQH